MHIRQMTPADTEFAFVCTQAEGWISETREIFQDFLAFDPAGCLVAEQAGEPVGMCVAVAYRENGFIGELIVIPEMRGRGFGRALLSRAVEYLQRQGIQNILLDGDLEAVPIYEKAGFQKICKSLRFYGQLENFHAPGENIRQMEASDLEAICRMDEALFGDDRSFFLRRLFERHPNLCCVAEIDGQVAGYILARPGVGLLTIGPWAASERLGNPAALLENIAHQAAGLRLRIGVLEDNQAAVALLRSYPGLEEGEYSWRMALGGSARLGNHPHLYTIGTAAKG